MLYVMYLKLMIWGFFQYSWEYEFQNSLMQVTNFTLYLRTLIETFKNKYLLQFTLNRLEVS